MNDPRIRLITDQAEAEQLGVRVGDQVREPDPEPVFVPFGEAVNPRSLGVRGPDPVPSFASIFPPAGESYDGHTDAVITDAMLDAATLAYVGQRYANAEEWRERFPGAWNETRIRVHAALLAAAAVRP